jgi:uncharacterized protein (DUF697 family)/uncharacterized tellurite resistance protein B-like protein
MSIVEKEALASLRILVAVARADGTVHNDERKSLAAALESLDLPGGVTVDGLLAETVDVDSQLRELSTPEAREQIYRSAYFMAYADGTCTKEEQTVLDRIAEVTGTDAEVRKSLDRLFVGRARGGDSTAPVSAIADDEQRSAAIEQRVRRYAVLAGALGAFPIPGFAIATDLAVVALQLKMISDVGAYFGHRVDKQAARSLLYGMGLGTGARLAVNNLAKLIPGFGSAVGAATSFVSTYALGKVMAKFFAAGDIDEAKAEKLRSEYKAAEAQAKAVYADHEDVVIQSQRQNEIALARLTADLKTGKISRDEFDARIAELA